MKLKIQLTLLLIVFYFGLATAQDDLLNELDSVQPKIKEIEQAAFKGLQIATMQSTKLASKGEWYFLVSHRFGDLTQGFENFLGLDNAYAKIGGIYGISNWLQVGVSRHTYNKIFEFAAKYKLANQEVEGFPITIVGYNTMDLRTDLKKQLYPNITFSDRLSFSTQLLISRKFNENFSLELNPIYVHKNLYEPATENKDQFLIGIGSRYKITKRMSVNLEYVAKMNQTKTNVFQNPLTVDLDIETGGHVFQLLFSNSQPMNDVAYFTNGLGKWNGGSLYFGFNLYRIF